jgi:xylulokinase
MAVGEGQRMPLVLGVDSSARATNVELRDSESGELASSGRAVHTPPERAWSSRERVTRCEQDPAVWWQGLIDARRDAGGAFGVSAIAVAGQPHALVTLDQDGHAIGAAKLGDDNEATPEAAALLDALGGAPAWAEACGSAPDAAFSITKLAWLARLDASAIARVAHVLTAHDWMTFRLCRMAVTDRGDASTTGFFSPTENRWCPELLALVDGAKDWEVCLPQLLDAGGAAGERERVLIATGTGSCMAAALAAGVQSRDVVVSFEDGWVGAVRDRPTVDGSGVVHGFADATGRFLPLVNRGTGVNMLEPFARALGVDVARFERMALDGAPGADGVQYFPARRTGPGLLPRSGTLTGLHDEIGPEVVARAVVEGIAHAALDDIDALRAAEVPSSGRITLVGGGRVQAVAHALADLGNRPVSVSSGDDATTGACALAAAAFHGRPAADIVAAWGVERVRDIEPDPRVDGEELRARYRSDLARFHDG